MKRRNTTRNALLTSIISLLLCVSMLVGTTFAWFTDEVKSGTNVIAAGNLDVELYHTDKAVKDKPVTTETVLFDDVKLWEPGAVAYEILTVANEGSLALKYNLTINVANANGVLHTDGKIYTLADVLKVAVVDATKLTSREAAIAAGNEAEWKQLGSWSEKGELYPEEGKDTKTYGIVIYWEPSADDNIWNLSNGKTTTDGSKQLTIDLGVHLVATQKDAESDSFGPEYDENANGLITIDGIQYLFTGEEFILYYVTDEYTKDTVVVPAGVTTIGGSAFENNSVVKTVVMSSTVRTIEKNAFKNSAVETVVLNEGLEEIGQFAFSQAKQLKNVNIPSTVKTIGLDAFKLTAMEEVTIPSTVTTIKSGAFREMPNLKTLTIIGENTVIGGDYAQNYIARGCPELTTVYLLGDNISFVSGSMTFSNDTAGCAKNITVYVTAESVKTSLMAASSSTDNDSNRFNVVVMNAVDETADIDTILTTAEEGATIYLSAGEYTITKSNQLADNLTVIGEDGATIYVDDNWSGSYKGNLKGDGLTLINVTVGDIVASDTTFIGCTFPYGFVGSEGNLNLTLTDCTVNGKLHFVEYGTNTTTITNTTATEAEYYSAGTVEFVGCTIGTLAPVNTNTVLTGCTVNEIDYENAGSATLVIDGKYNVGSSEMLSSAVDAGATEIVLAAGYFKLPSVHDKNLTLTGVGPETVVDYSHMGNYQEVSGSSFVFKNMTVVNAETGYPYPGLHHTTSVSYENCHITGTVNLFAPATFTNCTFDSKSAEHNVVTYGSDSVTFTDCKFTYGDRAVNCYAEDASSRDVVVTFTDCEFTKVAGKDTTGAIETNSSLMNSLTVTINDCTVNEGDLWFVATKYDSSKGAKTFVTVDGKVQVATAEQLAAVVAKGATNITLMDGEYDMPNFGEGKVNGVTFTGASRDGVVIKLYNTSSGGDFCLAGSTATLENMTIITEIKDWAGFQNAQNLTFNKCNFVNNLFLTGNATFNECHFEVETNHYNVWIYTDLDGEYTVEFNKCTFDTTGKSIYVDGNVGKLITVKVNECIFNDDDTCATDKAAIETGKNYGWKYEIIITDSTFNGFAVNPTGLNTGSTVWANKASLTTDQLNVVINGKEVY